MYVWKTLNLSLNKDELMFNIVKLNIPFTVKNDYCTCMYINTYIHSHQNTLQVFLSFKTLESLSGLSTRPKACQKNIYFEVEGIQEHKHAAVDELKEF